MIHIKNEIIQYVQQMGPKIIIGSDYSIPPNIPSKKVSSAIESYAPNILKEEVQFLLDTTIFGKADKGTLLTTSGLYFNNSFEKPGTIIFKSMKRIEKKSKTILVYHQNDEKVEIGHINFNIEETFKFLSKMMDYYQDNKEHIYSVINPDRILAIEVFGDSILINYVKFIIAYELNENETIEPSVFSEVLMLMTQLGFTKSMRKRLLDFLTDPNETMEEILDQIRNGTPRSNYSAIKISLIKDIIHIKRKRSNQPTLLTNNFESIYQSFGLKKNQILLLEQVIILDEKFINKELKESTYKSELNGLYRKLKEVNVPIEALYISGGTEGLSVLVMSSALDELGIDNTFANAFLMMLPKKWSLVIEGGVLLYQGAKILIKNHNSNVIREKMIQEIIMNHQNTINNFVEDIEYFMELEKKLTEARNRNEAKFEIYQKQIQLLKDTLLKTNERQSKLKQS